MGGEGEAAVKCSGLAGGGRQEWWLLSASVGNVSAGVVGSVAWFVAWWEAVPARGQVWYGFGDG